MVIKKFSAHFQVRDFTNFFGSIIVIHERHNVLQQKKNLILPQFLHFLLLNVYFLIDSILDQKMKIKHQ